MLYAKEVQDIWEPDGSSQETGDHVDFSSAPLHSNRTPSFPDTFEDSRLRARRTLPSGPQKEQKIKFDTVSESDASDDDEEQLFAQIDMAALSNRGKGNHICPKGTKCNKGGVDESGNLVSFERNSSFL